jgi:glyoxylase-like metal-dependent hydrolase (beta-lactamase superfamily II)
MRPVRLATLLLLSCASVAQAQTGMHTQRVADGVWALLQPQDRRFDDSNSTIILVDDGVLVIDTQNSPIGALAVLAEIRRLTDRPVKWVLNTHWHGDHVQGNEVYRDSFPDVEFIAQASVSEDIRERAMPAHAQDLKDVPGWLGRARAALESGVAEGRALTADEREQLRGQIQRRAVYLENLQALHEFVLPTRTLEDTLTLGTRPGVRLIHREGHTGGDVAAWLPDRRVLVSGDLLDDLPFTGHGSPSALLETLDWFQSLQPSTIIPGHGSVRSGLDHLRHVRALFQSIVRQAKAGVHDGLSLEETQRRADLMEFRDWFVNDDASARYWPFFTAEGVRRAWEEARNAGRTDPGAARDR